ncbi:hypothetical protein BX600DRAFT_430783 [Xylariales sp. PMI_506]|nr:hypothetical protein BX600DRAFT_430783 [Xylariales sp. PMI_506]
MSIPGYYFDPNKNRYFKIEDSKTAPDASAWSSENIKKRKLEDERAKLVIRRLKLNKDRIKPSKISNDPLVEGLLAREFGRVSNDLPAASFARGVVDKGILPLADARWGGSSKIVKNICITTLDAQSLISCYIPRDKNGRIHRQLLANYRTPSYRVAPYQELIIPQISDIKYHKHQKLVLATHREPGSVVSLWAFRPCEESNTREVGVPRWRLGENSESLLHLRAEQPAGAARVPGETRGDCQGNVVTPGPPGSSILCVVGSNRGVLLWDNRGELTQNFNWLAPKSKPTHRYPLLTDIFDLAFQDGHSTNILAGGRAGNIILGDTRTQAHQWRAFRHISSVTHLKSINEFHVLVSGLRDVMCTYDLRMIKEQSGEVSDSPRAPRKSCVVQPILRFPDYKNGAQINIGLDVDRDIGIVAAAHEDGKVAIYSLRSGHRLKSPDIDQIQSDPNRGPIRAIQFQTMPFDDNPTLFVGVNSNINAFSFGVRSLKDEA